MTAPLDLVIHCPRCGVQHIDAPQPEKGWWNPPHKSHECQGCGLRWRVADVPTNGVANCRTAGSGDTWAPPISPTVPRDREALGRLLRTITEGDGGLSGCSYWENMHESQREEHCQHAERFIAEAHLQVANECRAAAGEAVMELNRIVAHLDYFGVSRKLLGALGVAGRVWVLGVGLTNARDEIELLKAKLGEAPQ